MPRATLTPPAFRDLVARIPEDLGTGSLLSGGKYCFWGWCLHEAGLPDDCMEGHTDWVPLSCLAKPLATKAESIPAPQEREPHAILVQKLAPRLWPEVDENLVLDLMTANDRLAGSGRARKDNLLDVVESHFGDLAMEGGDAD
jgi:hypothetical protein